MRKETAARVAIALLAGAAALSGESKSKKPDLPTQGGSRFDAMSLPAEGMFKRDGQGNAFQVRGGEWVELPPINPGENVLDSQAGLLRLTAIQDTSAPESYRFSHFTSPVAFNDNENQWEVGGCYSTAEGLTCDAVFEVPLDKIDEIDKKIVNQ